MTVRIVQNEQEAAEFELPEAVQLSLLELQGAVKEGLMALSVGVGLAVVDAMLAEQVTALCGPKGKHQPNRKAKRHSSELSSLPIGGQRVQVRKPRVRSADDTSELQLPAWEHFASSDVMSEVVLERMLAGVSTRRYKRCAEPVGDVATSSTSKSAVSRAFVERTETAMKELMNRRLDGMTFVVLMIDGIEIADECLIAALGITIDGVKHPLGLWHGSTENATIASNLLADIIERGFDASDGLLCVIDGGKGIRKAINATFGQQALVQRCQRHKERNITDHFTPEDAVWVRTRLQNAWSDADFGRALDKLNRLAGELERSHPDAARSLREGMIETLTVTKLGMVGTTLFKTISSTNPIESMIGVARNRSRNVKYWRPGAMRLRWTAAGMLDAEKSFHRVQGYAQLPQLARAIKRQLADADTTHEAAQAA